MTNASAIMTKPEAATGTVTSPSPSPTAAANGTVTSPSPSPTAAATINAERIERLESLTSKVGIDLNWAIAAIAELKLPVFQSNQDWMISVLTWGKLCDHYATTQYAPKMKAVAGVPSTLNLMETTAPVMPTATPEPELTLPAAAAAPEPTAAAVTLTRRARATKAKVGANNNNKAAPKASSKVLGGVRFKTFTISNKTQITLGNFLDAQKYPPDQRVELIEAIALLPEIAEPKDESLAQAVVERIMTVCRQKNKRISRDGIIKAAKEMQGQPTG